MFVHQSFLVFWFPLFFILSNPLIFVVFLILCLAFCQHQGFSLKCKLRKHQYLVKRGVATFFLITCVLQNVKSYPFFIWPVFCLFLLIFKKHCKNRYVSTFLKATTYTKRLHFEGLLSGPSRGYYLVQVGVIIWSKSGLLSGPSWVRFKNANLDQIKTPEFFRAPLFFLQKNVLEAVETPCFIVFSWFSRFTFFATLWKMAPKNAETRGANCVCVCVCVFFATPIFVVFCQFFGKIAPFAIFPLFSGGVLPRNPYFL